MYSLANTPYKKKMNVLMVEHFLPGNTYTLELCLKLQKYIKLTLLCADMQETQDVHFGFRKVLYNGGKNRIQATFAYVCSVVSLGLEIRKKYDVIHIQTFKIPRVEIPIYIHLKRKSSLLVHTVHNVLPHECTPNDKRLFQKWYNACDVLIVHNIHCKSLLLKEFNLPESKIHVIAHGGYEDLKCLPDREDDGQRTFLFFGSIRQYKGLDVLLKAISFIPICERRSIRFIIAGKQGIDETNYQQMIYDLKIEDCVTWYSNRIDYNDLPKLFQLADAAIFPYKEIYGSGALLMAYTFHKPVIVSNVPAFIEETENGSTGLIFKSEDSQSLAEKILLFAKLPKIQVMNYKQVISNLLETKYSWKESARKTYLTYRNNKRNIR